MIFANFLFILFFVFFVTFPGLTPLTTAAERTKANIVEYFISSEEIDRFDRVEALELLGASFANDKENYSLDRCFHYLRQAMLERYRDDAKPLEKSALNCERIGAYGFESEVKDLKELEEIKFQEHRLHMQGLIIRQRILGCKSETVHPIVYRGAVCADHDQFDVCLQLWMHALTINAAIEHSCISNDLLRFAQIFCQMLNLGVSFESFHIEQVLQVAFQDMRKSARLLFEYRKNPTADDAESISLADRLQDELDENLLYTLYLLVLLAKLMPTLSDARQRSLCSLVYQVNQLRLRTRSGSSLLHMCVDARTPVGDVYTKSVCKFPCSATAELLIRCGADVNQTDVAGNTPLHVISAYERVISNFLTVHSIISRLLQAGAHHDYTNDALQTPLDRVVVSVAELILRSQVHIRLSCLAARAVNKHRISYDGLVPNHLHEFILKHQIKS
jgi:Fem-1 family protein b